MKKIRIHKASFIIIDENIGFYHFILTSTFFYFVKSNTKVRMHTGKHIFANITTSEVGQGVFHNLKSIYEKN